MTSAAKRKGSQAERDVVKWLKKWFPYADRRIAGAQLDKGDISGVDGVTIEIKDHKKMDLAQWVNELEVEIKNGKTWTGVVIHKRKQKGDVGEWYASMPAKVWMELLLKANGKTPDK